MIDINGINKLIENSKGEVINLYRLIFYTLLKKDERDAGKIDKEEYECNYKVLMSNEYVSANPSVIKEVIERHKPYKQILKRITIVEDGQEKEVNTLVYKFDFDAGLAAYRLIYGDALESEIAERV